jgi:predicted dehydrogenase
MLKVGLVGLGVMGRGHLACYKRLEAEGASIHLVAICDVDAAHREGRDIVPGNIGAGGSVEVSMYAQYSDIAEMLKREKLDYVDIALPTYLHAQAAITAMEAGCDVLCEKPMARTVEQCDRMAASARATGRKLMTAHCLRFWPAYEYLKECVETSRYGKVVSAYFFRGGGTPRWSWQNWLLDGRLSGGCLLDQHIHDVDMVHWLFGLPDAVTSSAVNVIPGSGYDAVSTRYLYADGKAVCAEDDWTIGGAFGFNMMYRVNFQRGSLHFSHGKVDDNPADGAGFEPELPKDDGYYREIRYFCECISHGVPVDRCSPESTRDTIMIALAEQESADKGGAIVRLGQGP